MAYSTTFSETYSTVDVENVMRNLKTDLLMIAESTRAISLAEACDYAADFELLAKGAYLEYVDVTLFDGFCEVRAVRYTVTTKAGDLTASRPGGVLWPRVSNPYVRIVIGRSNKWSNLPPEADTALRKCLKKSWGPTNTDISHALLCGFGGRNFVSNAYGLSRKDFSV